MLLPEWREQFDRINKRVVTGTHKLPGVGERHQLSGKARQQDSVGTTEKEAVMRKLPTVSVHESKSKQEVFIAAMFLMFCRAPKKAEPDVDGKFELGEVGEAPEKTWTRLTPYSLVEPK